MEDITPDDDIEVPGQESAIADEYVEEPDAIETSQEESEPASDSGIEDEPADTPEPPKRNRAQERIDELTADKYRLKGQLEAFQQRLADLEAAKAAPKQPEPELTAPAEPALDDFDDLEGFLKAQRQWTVDMIRHETMLAKRQAETEAQRKAREAEEARAHESRNAEWQKQVVKAAEKYSDYMVVAHNPELPVSASMAEAIQLADNGADVLYFLGKNPERSARIAQMSPSQAAIEIGRISGQIGASKPPANKPNISKAPKPATPDKATGTPTKDPSKMSQAEYNAWRESGGGA